MTGFDALDRDWLIAKPGVKWSRVADGTLAAWVADMDFPIPDRVAAAMQSVIEGGDLGYANPDDGNPLAQPFVDRMWARHGWEADPGRVWTFTDVLNALQAILTLTTEPNDAIAVHTPTYPPFPSTIKKMSRRLVPLPFHSTPEGWRFDLDRASRAVARSDARVLLLVNPHNPTGRVLTRLELEGLLMIAKEHDLLVISDEVHADLLYPGYQHIPFAALGPDAAGRTITINSASKSFNLAGIRCASAHFGSDRAWDALTAQPEYLFGVVSNLSVTATIAAWEHGDAWLNALTTHLADQRSRLLHALTTRLPNVAWHEPEGTYLAWLDFSALGLGTDPAGFFRHAAQVELSPGRDFGIDHADFARLNFATSAGVLDEVVDRMAKAVSGS